MLKHELPCDFGLGVGRVLRPRDPHHYHTRDDQAPSVLVLPLFEHVATDEVAVVYGSTSLRRAPAAASTEAINRRSVQLYNLADEIGETKNLDVAMPEKVAKMKAVLEKLTTDGHHTPGSPQKSES